MKNRYTDNHVLVLTAVTIRDRFTEREALTLRLTYTPTEEDGKPENFYLRFQTNTLEPNKPILHTLQAISPAFARASVPLANAPKELRRMILKEVLVNNHDNPFGMVDTECLCRLVQGEKDQRGSRYPDTVYINDAISTTFTEEDIDELLELSSIAQTAPDSEEETHGDEAANF